MTSHEKLQKFANALADNRRAYMAENVARGAIAAIWVGEGLGLTGAETKACNAIADAHDRRLAGKLSITACAEECTYAITMASTPTW